MLWGIDWAELLPVETGSGVFAHASSYERALPFVRAHYSSIFEEVADGPFAARMGARKERYYRIAADFFEFKLDDVTIGLLIGSAVDWSTYYVRSAAVLPQHQGKKVIQRFFPSMFEHLRRVGVERVEADTSPSNMATLHLLTRLRFNPVGTTLSDRWGAMVRFTRFLHEPAESVFLRQFCTGVGYQLRDRVQRAADDQGPERRKS